MLEFLLLPFVNLTEVAPMGWLAFSSADGSGVMCQQDRFAAVWFEVDKVVVNQNATDRGPTVFSWENGSPVTKETATSNFGTAVNPQSTFINIQTASWHVGVKGLTIRLWLFCNECRVSNSLGLSRHVHHEWAQLDFLLPNWMMSDTFLIRGEPPILLQAIAAL
jgi:hypothetical protein